MKNLVKVTKVLDSIEFSDGSKLYDYHEQDCCEHHYLDFGDHSLKDFEDLEFDLNSEFFKKIEDYGIELIPVKGHSIKIPGYASNNGYYSPNLILILEKPDGSKIKWDVTECQAW